MNFDVNTSLTAILEAFAIIVAFAAGIKALLYFFTPFKKIRQDIEELKDKVNEHDGFLKNDKESIEELTDLVRDSVKLQLALVNHEIDGNDVEYMKELRKEIHDKLL